MSYKTERRKRAHEGKKVFPSQAATDAAIRKWERNGIHGLQSYKCPLCSHWHAGHSKNAKTKDVQPEKPSGSEDAN